MSDILPCTPPPLPLKEHVDRSNTVYYSELRQQGTRSLCRHIHAWGEALLKDFFQATIGVPYAIMIISLTECMLFALGRSKDLGMSYEDSKAHCQQLNGTHPWVGSAIEVIALQRMVKEGRYDVVRAKQYTHKKTKERLAKMHASPTTSPAESPQS